MYLLSNSLKNLCVWGGRGMVHVLAVKLTEEPVCVCGGGGAGPSYDSTSMVPVSLYCLLQPDSYSLKSSVITLSSCPASPLPYASLQPTCRVGAYLPAILRHHLAAILRVGQVVHRLVGVHHGHVSHDRGVARLGVRGGQGGAGCGQQVGQELEGVWPAGPAPVCVQAVAEVDLTGRARKSRSVAYTRSHNFSTAKLCCCPLQLPLPHGLRSPAYACPLAPPPPSLLTPAPRLPACPCPPPGCMPLPLVPSPSLLTPAPWHPPGLVPQV